MRIRNILERIVVVMKIIIYKFIFNKNINFKSITTMRLSKSFKIIIEEKSSRLSFGKNISCRDYVIFRGCGGNLEIGNNVFFNNFVSINCMNNIKIGDDCLFGENIKIYDHDHIFYNRVPINKQGFKSNYIEIGNNVWIGSNCVILKGVKIGSNVVIGAGTIIRESIPSGTIIKSNSLIEASPIIYK